MDYTPRPPYEDTPLRIIPLHETSRPNDEIDLYSGTMDIKFGELSIPVNGKIYWEWFPNPGSYVLFEYEQTPLQLRAIDQNKFHIEVLIDGQAVGNASTTNITLPINGPMTIKAVFKKLPVIGDRSISAESVSFSIPNMLAVDGRPVIELKLNDEGVPTGQEMTRARLQFATEKFTIMLDQQVNYRNMINDLRNEGGFSILSSGELTSTSGSITFSESETELHIFSQFLSFINGLQTAPILRCGVFEDSNPWVDISSYRVSPYAGVKSWRVNDEIEPIEKLWTSFREAFKHDNKCSFLVDVIHWYSEANRHSGLIDGAIIFSQTALELIFNYWVVEDRKIIKGKDVESLSAANKIRQILALIGIPSQVPHELQELLAFVNKDQNIEDAPDVIVYLRNALVHGQLGKRTTYKEIEMKVKYQALETSLWYIELAVLKILGYSGRYQNRCKPNHVGNSTEDSMPWMKAES